jgi:hypothetical protein
LCSYGGAKLVVIFDEATEEFMQSALKDFLDPAIR